MILYLIYNYLPRKYSTKIQIVNIFCGANEIKQFSQSVTYIKTNNAPWWALFYFGCTVCAVREPNYWKLDKK